ncbi:Pentatricopeptide repeat-containing protein [Camellia lanceoleosa]|uniref:Pentatricopeptide repeat-containing protein n=1 Tax=Camellia lanceoleosa TaxID=1840588 RepID=A0ACC0J3Y5_9ERIC|nr:Pentatricopeptide repeat-containing protein [Camellia lanceoleosa]
MVWLTLYLESGNYGFVISSSFLMKCISALALPYADQKPVFESPTPTKLVAPLSQGLSDSRRTKLTTERQQAYRTSQEPSVLKLKEPALDEITHALVGRYLNFTRQDISSLWFLCKQEASLLNITNQACALFTPSEVCSFEYARRVFDQMPKRDTVSWNEMIFSYAGSGNMHVAQSIFDSMPERDVVSWNSIISGYV